MDKQEPQKKRHITATVDESVCDALEKYRTTHKEPKLPDRSQIIQDALVMYLESKRKPI